MSLRWRQLMKRMHPEGIPWPGSVLYTLLSSTKVFLRHYDLVARDIAHYGPANRILDIGTGPGHLLMVMRETLPDTELIGIDISPAMVVQAHRKINTHTPNARIKVLAAAANALPFTGETFDRVVSTGSLHHWKDPVRALSEVHRVLKMDGYALMYDLIRDMPEAVCKEIRDQFGGLRLAILWLHSFEEPFLNAEEMEALGEQTEFSVEETKFTGALCCLVLQKCALQ
ncbi:hypothetical protein D3OALGA1CA_5270 [Olavius algarvensis associated proteobacterium Delta 3]|nr:hypothetical protein D3OALGB2SA_530 [Olavius algarvensis associated proteobacterium Delta 3]CAB5164323.1 hypothetical protein D3OALGA1CA_5270 [Olavius algarvensis associated proteobacterium Delta 3]